MRITTEGSLIGKKPKKGKQLLGAARCVNLKVIAQGSRNEGKRKKKMGNGVEVDQRGTEEVTSQSLVSGVHKIFEVDGSVVPETPTNLMGDSRRKRAEVEHLLNVEKEAGVTFTMADGTVVDRLVVMEDVDTEKGFKERREVI